MTKKKEETKEIVEEFFKQNDLKEIKSINDMYSAWKNFFAIAFQKLLEMDDLVIINLTINIEKR